MLGVPYFPTQAELGWGICVKTTAGFSTPSTLFRSVEMTKLLAGANFDRSSANPLRMFAEDADVLDGLHPGGARTQNRLVVDDILL
jgi:hypothetical protein